MNQYNFTEGVRLALRGAREEAVRLSHEYVGTEHILLGLVRKPEGEAAVILGALGVTGAMIRTRVDEMVKTGKGSKDTRSDLPYTSRAKKVLELAMSEARERRDSYVGTEHLLLGLLREEKGLAAQVLISLGVTLDKARAALRGELTHGSHAFRIEIDDHSEKSIYEQIVARVQEGVATGAVAPGDRLPTVRELADQLDIAPGTVARAYGELERLGVVSTEGTRGTRVAPRQRPAMADDARPQTLAGLLRPVAVAAFHLGASASELRAALEDAMKDIFPGRDAAA